MQRQGFKAEKPRTRPLPATPCVYPAARASRRQVLSGVLNNSFIDLTRPPDEAGTVLYLDETRRNSLVRIIAGLSRPIRWIGG